MEDEMKDKGDETPWHMPIPEFGKRYYGLGRSASYAAAARGDIPVFRVGGKLMGLPHAAEAQLSGQGSPAARPRDGGAGSDCSGPAR
jgi:hypothetical protein